MNTRTRRIVVSVAALLALLLTARLGLWQLDRAQQKLALQAAVERAQAQPALAQAELVSAFAPAPTVAAGAGASAGSNAAASAATASSAKPPAGRATLLHRAVRLQGTWLPERTIHLDNRQMNGRPGFFVLTPLRLGEGPAVVLVQRGWIARDFQDRSRLLPVNTPAGPVEIDGRLAFAPARLYEFEAAGQGPIRQNLDIAAFRAETGLPLLDVLVLQTGAASDGLLREWPAFDAGVSKHHGYAAQWFGLSALILILYVWFQFIQPRRNARRAG